jgi:hypothetical protein
MNRLKVGTDAYEVDEKTFLERFAEVGVFTACAATKVDWLLAFHFTSNTENCYWVLKVNKCGGGWSLACQEASGEKKRLVTLCNASLESVTDVIEEARRHTWKWVVSDDDEDELGKELPLSPVEANIDDFRAAVIAGFRTKAANGALVRATSGSPCVSPATDGVNVRRAESSGSHRKSRPIKTSSVIVIDGLCEVDRLAACK